MYPVGTKLKLKYTDKDYGYYSNNNLFPGNPFFSFQMMEILRKTGHILTVRKPHSMTDFFAEREEDENQYYWYFGWFTPIELKPILLKDFLSEED